MGKYRRPNSTNRENPRLGRRQGIYSLFDMVYNITCVLHEAGCTHLNIFRHSSVVERIAVND